MRAAALVLVLFAAACGGDGGGDDDDDGDGAPVVVDCDQVRYDGFTFFVGGCDPGVASFTVDTSQMGHSACFDIVCGGGCIADAQLCAP